jgi:hypothetical protein
MKWSWRDLPTEDRLLWSLGAGALFVGSFIVGHWWGREQLIFEALQTVFALAAFVAAAAAMKATWPQYRAWRASPVIRVWIEMADDEEDVPRRVVGGTAEFAKGSFVVLVVIENAGEGLMRAALVNVIAPLTCDLQPLDPDKTHYVSPLPSRNVELLDENGNAAPARFTVARDDITAGHHVFHVLVTPDPDVMSVPIVAKVSGDPMPPEPERQRHALFTRAS